jgi:hypothetical protein
LAFVEKELQQVKMDNATLARYINVKRKKEEDWMKEEARKKLRESQSFKDVWTWRK